jgi:hypothetical protein
MAGHFAHQYISGSGYLEGACLGADMRGVVLTARAYDVEARIITNFADLGGANALHLVQSCFKDERPAGPKRLGSPWQGMCLPDLPPQIGAWPRPHPVPPWRRRSNAALLPCPVRPRPRPLQCQCVGPRRSELAALAVSLQNKQRSAPPPTGEGVVCGLARHLARRPWRRAQS